MRRYLFAASSRPRIAALLAENSYSSSQFIEILLNKCQGLWLYLKYVLNEIEEGKRMQLDLNRLPLGITRYYLEFFGKWRRGHNGSHYSLSGSEDWQSIYLPLLTGFAAVPDLVGIDQLITWLGLSVTESGLRALLHDEWRPYLSVHRRQGQSTFRLYHSSLRSLARGMIDEDSLNSLNEAEQEMVWEIRHSFVRSCSRIADFHLGSWGGLADGLPVLRRILEEDSTILVPDLKIGLRNLMMYLVNSQRTDDAFGLLILMQDKPLPATHEGQIHESLWRKAQYVLGHPSYYLSDVNIYLESLQQEEVIQQIGKSEWLARSIFCYSMLSGMRDLFDKGLALVIDRIVAFGRWTSRQALDYTQSQLDSQRKWDALKRLIPLLSNDELEEVLQTSSSIPGHERETLLGSAISALISMGSITWATSLASSDNLKLYLIQGLVEQNQFERASQITSEMTDQTAKQRALEILISAGPAHQLTALNELVQQFREQFGLKAAPNRLLMELAIREACLGEEDIAVRRFSDASSDVMEGQVIRLIQCISKPLSLSRVVSIVSGYSRTSTNCIAAVHARAISLKMPEGDVNRYSSQYVEGLIENVDVLTELVRARYQSGSQTARQAVLLRVLQPKSDNEHWAICAAALLTVSDSVYEETFQRLQLWLQKHEPRNIDQVQRDTYLYSHQGDPLRGRKVELSSFDARRLFIVESMIQSYYSRHSSAAPKAADSFTSYLQSLLARLYNAQNWDFWLELQKQLAPYWGQEYLCSALAEAATVRPYSRRDKLVRELALLVEPSSLDRVLDILSASESQAGLMELYTALAVQADSRLKSRVFDRLLKLYAANQNYALALQLVDGLNSGQLRTLVDSTIGSSRLLPFLSLPMLKRAVSRAKNAPVLTGYEFWLAACQQYVALKQPKKALELALQSKIRYAHPFLLSEVVRLLPQDEMRLVLRKSEVHEHERARCAALLAVAERSSSLAPEVLRVLRRVKTDFAYTDALVKFFNLRPDYQSSVLQEVRTLKETYDRLVVLNHVVFGLNEEQVETFELLLDNLASTESIRVLQTKLAVHKIRLGLYQPSHEAFRSMMGGLLKTDSKDYSSFNACFAVLPVQYQELALQEVQQHHAFFYNLKAFAALCRYCNTRSKERFQLLFLEKVDADLHPDLLLELIPTLSQVGLQYAFDKAKNYGRDSLRAEALMRIAEQAREPLRKSAVQSAIATGKVYTSSFAVRLAQLGPEYLKVAMKFDPNAVVNYWTDRHLGEMTEKCTRIPYSEELLQTLTCIALACQQLQTTHLHATWRHLFCVVARSSQDEFREIIRSLVSLIL